jgi:hypothetical protein
MMNLYCIGRWTWKQTTKLFSAFFTLKFWTVLSFLPLVQNFHIDCSRLGLKRELILEAGWVPQLQTTCKGRHIASMNQLMRLDIRHRRKIHWPLEGKRIQCYVCSTNNRKTRKNFRCPDCSMGLCPRPCFMIYHTKLHFRRLNWH